MDVLSFHHLQPIARNHPSDLRVAHIGMVPNKTDTVRQEFSTYNFSFVLRGEGYYQWGGALHSVRAPCVLRQWPGEQMNYGPEESWDELFLIYPLAAADALARRGYIRPERPFWSIDDARRMRHHLDDLSRLVTRPADPAHQVDRIDRCCEQLILESLLGASPALYSGADRVASVRRWVETHWRDDHDFDDLAAQAGLSSTHFRRLWQRSVGIPPHRFLIEERLRHACQALIATETPIAEIARTHGFFDPLYFSRRFRAFVGESAREYRKRYRTAFPFRTALPYRTARCDS